MASKSSWRLKFIDIDSSFSISTEAGTIKGYMVVRAPKGETEPYYFEKGNQSAIEAYVGLGGSDYPDIEEAIAFNREYGIYISAPAGASDEYPSYIGGKYLTSDGLIDLYNVPSKDLIDYTQAKDFSQLGENIRVNFVPNPRPYNPENGNLGPEDAKDIGTKEAYAIYIEKIPANDWDELKEIAVNYKGDVKNGIKAGTYYYQIDKDNHKIFCENEDGDRIKDVYAGIWGQAADMLSYYIVIGGSDWIATAGEKYGDEPSGPTIQEVLSEGVFKDGDGSTYTFGKGAKDVTMKYSRGSVKFNLTIDEGKHECTLVDAAGSYADGQELKYTFVGTGIETLDLTLVSPKETEDVPQTINLTRQGEYVPVQVATMAAEVEESLVQKVVTLDKALAADKVLAGLGLNTVTSTNKYSTSEIPFFNLSAISPKLEEACFDPEIESSVKWIDVVNYFMNGFSSEGASWPGTQVIIKNEVFTLKAFKLDGLEMLTFLMDIKDKTFGVILQKSASEKKTITTITGIGYDKWLYDTAMPALFGDFKQIPANQFATTPYIFGVNRAEAQPFGVSNVNREIKCTIFKVDPDKITSKDTKLAEVVSEITKEFITQNILITKVLVEEGGEVTHDEAASMNSKIFYIQTKDLQKLAVDKEKDGDKGAPFLIPDINYNTFSFKVAEEVYSAVNLTSGGEFHGSMDENGRDSYGGNIYWPNVLNENDFSFVEVIPVNTFDKMVNADGIFTGKRIVDDILEEDFTGEACASSLKTELQGQRFIAHVIQENRDKGMIGSAWQDSMLAVIDEGWKEAYDTNYDDVYVFMEPTGREELKSQLSSLVEGTHKLAIAISAKIISKPEFNNPATITVTARNKQHAQYVGEFMEYDSRTGKNYYTTPIGDIGKMCCRIFDKKMGGWAPAWYNYNSMGGQLDRAVLKAKYNFSDSATQILDKKGINPIVYNADDGLMVVSSKTTQDPNNETDWSFLEHVMAFVLLKREIRDNVMRPQIEKPIDDFWMDIRQTQVDAILDKRINGANKIWTAAKCDIKGVNTDVTKAMRKFCIYVKVKVTPFAQTVELTLENVAQTTSL